MSTVEVTNIPEVFKNFSKYNETVDLALLIVSDDIQVNKDIIIEQRGFISKVAFPKERPEEDEVVALVPDEEQTSMEDQEVTEEPIELVDYTQKTLYTKYANNLYVKVMETVNDEDETDKLVHVSAVYLQEVNGTFIKKVIAYEDGVQFIESEVIPGEGEEIDPETELTIPNEAIEVTPDEGILPQVKLPVPCFNNSSGCCTFSNNGKTVHYKWCGPGCSGTGACTTANTKNGLDKCCCNHDKCYGQTKTYPNRCKCDLSLLNCSVSKRDPGSDRVWSAFVFKRLYYKCASHGM
ncbi:hypothetical protein ACTHQ0_24035 [Priestia megaterium]|uniref:hypothetical protein n=1 Tax=Priestia megaterium TaxID=1404 RepID=UPI003F8162FC